MRIPALLVCLLLIPAFTESQQSQPQTPGKEKTESIAGVYECNGVNPVGRPYKGIAEIFQIEHTFIVRWTVQDDTVVGVGMIRDRVFAVSYITTANILVPTIVVYTIAENGNLSGVWATGGDGDFYPEILTKIKGHPEINQDPQQLEPKPQKPQPAPGTIRVL